ncbi:LrgB family protein [Irregularibacter muris]|uniref:LrgB family protein n=1 Tax=Irregularibacter muris TaxID=1796619 RepID=A0AAE3HK94_9FIRM|nr:LrgB family protein [Irregularibacter muris]MCR1900293.1 LrgB family protein [Irregularibacter muris]
MLNILQSSPVFGLVITLVVFGLSYKLYDKYKMTMLHPTVITLTVLILLLMYSGIDYKDYYENGGNIIHFLLAPATIVLALPLFRQWEILKINFFPIVVGIMAGSVTGALSVFFLGKIFGLDKIINISLLSKSVTTPIAVEITESIGGIASITILGVMVAGSVGAILGPKLLKFFRVKNDIAAGVAMGTASHGFGTARALEEGEVQGAMAGLAIGLMGLFTAIAVPLILGIVMK